MATIKDVALRANVSQATVSRVFNQPELVTESTRERVLAVASELGFLPNSLARGLATGKSGVVGLIVPDITNPVFGYVARGCADRLLANGLTMALYNSDEQYAREQELLTLNERRQADGLMIASQTAFPPQPDEPARSPSLPIIYIERWPDRPRVDAATIDNKLVGRLACEHLLSLGHRRIGIVTGLLHTFTGLARLQGFAEALTQAGCVLPDRWVIESNFKSEGGRQAAQMLMALAEPPSALFVSSDVMAYGLLDELQQHGWRVPEDISVVGCHDLPMSSLLSPKLTTIRTPLYELGSQAAELLLKRLERPTRRSTVKELTVQLVIRQSTCPPASAGQP